MNYKGKKPNRYNSTFWWMLASVLSLALAVWFCVEFMKNLIAWGLCV